MQNIKLGLDCPTNLLYQVQPFADYDYVLVDKACQDPMYLEYFKNSKKEKLLNNRILMQWEPVPLDRIKKVWDIIGGRVIAPDWMWDSEKTFGAYEECCRTFGEENVVGVIQGINRRDVDWCIDLYGEKVAIPFDVGSPKEDPVEAKVYRRMRLVGQLCGMEIHLLGLTSLDELDFYRDSSSRVTSLNTGLPVMLALEGKKMEDFCEDKRHSSYHGMDMDSSSYDKSVLRLLEDNISFLRRLL